MTKNHKEVLEHLQKKHQEEEEVQLILLPAPTLEDLIKLNKTLAEKEIFSTWKSHLNKRNGFKLKKTVRLMMLAIASRNVWAQVLIKLKLNFLNNIIFLFLLFFLISNIIKIFGTGAEKEF